MRAGLRRDLHPPGLRVPDEGHAALGAHVADVHRGIDRGRRRDLPGGAAVLRRGGDAGQPQLPGQGAVVHLPAPGQVHVLAVGGEGEAQFLRLLQGLQQAAGAPYRHAVIADGDGPGCFQGFQVRELLPLHPLGDAGRGVHSRVGRGGLLQQGPHPLRAVHRRLGVGHGQQAGDASGGSGPAPGEHILLVGEARVPQMDVHVHQPGGGHQAPPVQNFFRFRSQVAANGRDLPLLQQQVPGLVQALAGVYQPGPFDEDRHGISPFLIPESNALPSTWSGRAAPGRNIPAAAAGRCGRSGCRR